MSSTETPPNNAPEGPSEDASSLRHETPDGTVYWGTVSTKKFEQAAATFPTLRYVLEAYFGSPERQSRDAEFAQRYQSIGETTSEFEGLAAELKQAIRQFSLSANLVNGMMGLDLPAAEVRELLVQLDDQLHLRGEYAVDVPDEDEDEGRDASEEDRFLIQSAPDRVQSTFMHRREIPIGPLKGHPLPLIAYFGAGIGLVVVGILITFIPIVGRFGMILIIAGAVIAFVVALAIIGMGRDYNNPEEDDEEEDDEDRKGILQRINPFSN